MRYGIVSLPRWYVAVLAVALAWLLALAGGAQAETYKVTNTTQLTEAVSKANTNQLAGGAYAPLETLTLTNTTGVQTVEGPTTAPTAKIEGGQVAPIEAELFVLKAGVAATFKNVEETTGGGKGLPAIDDFGT